MTRNGLTSYPASPSPLPKSQLLTRQGTGLGTSHSVTSIRAVRSQVTLTWPIKSKTSNGSSASLLPQPTLVPRVMVGALVDILTMHLGVGVSAEEEEPKTGGISYHKIGNLPQTGNIKEN